MLHQPFYRALLACIAVFIIGLSSCNNKPSLFQQIPASQSNINFTNTLASHKLLNILYYLYYYNGGGVATGDVNNDGLPDIYFTANHKAGNKLYINKGNFVFEDVTEKAGVAGTADWCTGATMADVNGDGLLDIYVCAVSGMYDLKGANELFINKGDGTFEAAAEKYGLNFSGLSTQAAFFDFDQDGDLDLYLLNHSKKPHANVVDTANRMIHDTLSGDILYRQDLEGDQIRFTDISKQAGIYQSSLGYGLGLAIADLNNDGWDDIYVGNDFHENDYYYVNNRNGTFTESGRQHFGHYSRFSMGNDAADYNNDGHIDVVTVDMLPPDEKTMKTYGSDENPNMYKVKLGINGYQDQYSRNCLQRNNGNGMSFSETALLSGVAATDWSWSPLFADFDNDGNKDLFISSGIVKRPVDLDYVQFVSSMQAKKNINNTDKYDEETIANMPDGSSIPFLFRGDGKLHFENVSEAWGTAGLKGYFNGAAYADLDNDGRLDLVMNCINAPAVILKNNGPAANFVRLKLKGDGKNTLGTGAKAYLFSDGTFQLQQLMPTRGFMSASEPIIHFGLGTRTADSLLLVWPDQRFEVIKQVGLNQISEINQANASGTFIHDQWFPTADAPFADITAQAGISWQHRENDFVDFNRQYLLPHMQSTRGPKVAVADVNGDGLEDFYVCGAHDQPGRLMMQKADGTFYDGKQDAFAANAAAEEVDALFFDANGDGFTDLYVVSGGYQFDDGNALLNDHLYLNNGSGIFTESPGSLPAMAVNKSCVASADVDGDGDIDLFVGALAHAGKYGTSQPSFLLINDGKGKFALSNALPQETEGMITSAVFADMNGDNLPDLVVAGEWMPVVVYLNQSGKWQRQPVKGSSGLWQTLHIGDVNGDGKADILGGNWGLNSKLAAGKNGPLKMYVKDFDKNGREEQIVAYTVDGKEYTFLAKDELERALPVLKKAYLTYGEVAGQTVQYMFYDLFTGYREWQAEQLASCAFVNDGKGGFSMNVLPDALQFAPVFAYATHPQSKLVTAGGNFYGVVPYEGRYDALSLSSWRINYSQGAPVQMGSMPAINGEVRDAKWINRLGKPVLIVARNNMPLLLLETGQP